MATCWQSAIGTASPFKTFEARSALCFTVASRCHFERAADIDAIHFDTALRGYRMDQVDEVLEALRERLAAYESGDHPTMKLPRVPSSVRPREPR